MHSEATPIEPARHRPREILIIGAGMAGLTAAITILESTSRQKNEQAPKVTILEAMNTPGGRISSRILSNGVEVSAGAHWFHGGEDNPVYKWAKERFKLGPTRIDTAQNRFNIASDDSFPQAMREQALDLLARLYAEWETRHPDDDISLADLAAMSQSDAVRLIADERAINWMAVDSAKQVSAREFFGDDTGSGGVQLERGIGKIIHAMVRKIEYLGGKIITRAAVAEVTRSPQGVRVVDMKDNEYRADRVIVTVPVGALKAGLVKFSDRLHERLDPVLDDLYAAKMTKIILPLREEFFDRAKIAPDTFVTLYGKDHSWLSHLRTRNLPVVTLFACGVMSDFVETSHRADIEYDLRAVLDRIPQLDGYRNAEDGRMLITDWTTNPYFSGAYTAMKPGGTRVDPLHCGDVIFAGEAFVADMAHSPGQMIGAWYSGRKAGRDILRQMGIENSKTRSADFRRGDSVTPRQKF